MIGNKDEFNFVTGALEDFRGYFIEMKEFAISELLSECLFECYKSFHSNQNARVITKSPNSEGSIRLVYSNTDKQVSGNKIS
ncbi:MAG: hypothetical protein L3J33_12430 [Rhodobacteraceae bacterium]|nr:hypothetical protein [Paracoccaceae bacterium]